MRLLRNILCLSLTVLSYQALAEDASPRTKHSYQSDVSRLRKIVINSLYSHSEVFIRELISNANDAVEKFRLTALTNEGMWNGDALNITIKIEKDEDGKGGRIVITDTGIGMSPEDLTTNLGTLAKSGTSDFLARAETSDGTGTGNLIGAFGLGFYSSFLVADRVQVASLPPKTDNTPVPIQHLFTSGADENSFEVYPDPRGNTLGRGTEITLHLKSDALEYLENSKLIELINKHSSYSSAFPIYIFDRRWDEVPVEEEDSTSNAEEAAEKDDDEAIIEDVEEKKEDKEPKTKKVYVEEWVQLNVQPPIWARDSKDLTDSEYTLFFNVFWRDFSRPLSWSHFSGDSGNGVSFKALLYLPGKLADEYWQQPLAYKSSDLKLMVKRVFITSDFGKFALPQWASWIKAVIDADDLPLNVSRETLQSTGFMKQIKNIIVKRLIQLFNKLAEDPKKFEEVSAVYGNVFKLGAVEDAKNREKLATLCRFTTTQRNFTSFDQYIENRKQGQKQIFYLAEMAKTADDLAKSVFVEKLHARGYEVLLLTDPLDEILINHLREWKKLPFQDVAKAGLKFGDEEQDAEVEKEEQEHLVEKFQPLLDWLKNETRDVVRDVVVSNRLVQSPCAIVADAMGYTANVQKMMAASGSKKGNTALHDFAMKARTMEINPRSPLIEGLLRRVNELPSEEDEDLESVQELKEVAAILIDGALVRSGFGVSDSHGFFSRIDRVLRRSLGVSETAPTDESVKPAPPVDPTLPKEDAQTPLDQDDGKPKVILPDHLKDKVQIEMEEMSDDEYRAALGHDEL